jgi:hypothetical protein
VVVDPFYTLQASMHLHLLLQTNIVLIGSANIPTPLKGSKPFTLDKVGGKALSPVGGESKIPIFCRQPSEAEATLKSSEKFVLCIHEQTVCLPNKCDYITLNHDQALWVLGEALDLCQG